MSANKMGAQEILEKLSTYREQLAQVNALLERDQTNQQFLKIKGDLLKVISLTEILYNESVSQPASSSSSSSSSISSSSPPPPPSPPSSSSSSHLTTNKKRSLESSGDEFEGETPSGSAIMPGDVVEVIGGDRPYAGIVMSMQEEDGETFVRVRYFEIPDSIAKVSISTIQKPQSSGVSKELAVVGFKCQCKYSADQQYYDAIVTSLGERGKTVIVTYTEYGNSEEVPIEYLRFKNTISAPSSSSSTSTSTSKAASLVPSVPSMIKIPEKLQILPTDTEEEKLRKKKKLKVINYKNKLISQETELVAVQQNWKQFQQKGTKKGILKEKSHFATPDEVGGRVGVVGSGKGVTINPEKKKYKLNI